LVHRTTPLAAERALWLKCGDDIRHTKVVSGWYKLKNKNKKKSMVSHVTRRYPKD